MLMPAAVMMLVVFAYVVRLHMYKRSHGKKFKRACGHVYKQSIEFHHVDHSIDISPGTLPLFSYCSRPARITINNTCNVLQTCRRSPEERSSISDALRSSMAKVSWLGILRWCYNGKWNDNLVWNHRRSSLPVGTPMFLHGSSNNAIV